MSPCRELERITNVTLYGAEMCFDRGSTGIWLGPDDIEAEWLGL